ncbi:MAG TPA: hypothetical protein VFT92_01505 [Nitrospira sp.]|nr:hypothetical protein [Nitrospira sp.]
MGANLFQSALTKWCLMEDILKAGSQVKVRPTPVIRHPKVRRKRNAS